MRLGYADLQAKDTEVLAVTLTDPQRGPQYHQLFDFAHPYLCDPTGETPERYGIPIDKGLAMRGLVGGLLTSPQIWQQIIKAPPGFRSKTDEGTPGVKHGRVDGIFVVDKQGIVRYARTGFGANLLPGNAELQRLVAGLEDGPAGGDPSSVETGS